MRNQKKVLALLSTVAFGIDAAHADMMDGTWPVGVGPNNPQVLTNKILNFGTGGTALGNGQAGRFLPVIESSGTGSSSPFIRIQLCAWNGNQVTISGIRQTIPAGACTTPGGGVIASLSSTCINKTCSTTLAANTDYYAGVFMLNGVMTMNFWPVSSGGYVSDPTYGNITKFNDPATSLVGIIHTNVTTSLNGNQNTQDSVSLFNPVRISLLNSVSTATFTSTLTIELNSANRLHWVQFSWDVPNMSASCSVNNTTAGNVVNIGIGMDSTSTPAGSFGTFQAPFAGYQGNATGVAQAPGAEGSHFATVLVSVSGGTGSIPSCNIISSPLRS